MGFAEALGRAAGGDIEGAILEATKEATQLGIGLTFTIAFGPVGGIIGYHGSEFGNYGDSISIHQISPPYAPSRSLGPAASSIGTTSAIFSETR